MEFANPEHPFTAMLISRSRGTCLISTPSYPFRPRGDKDEEDSPFSDDDDDEDEAFFDDDDF